MKNLIFCLPSTHIKLRIKCMMHRVGITQSKAFCYRMCFVVAAQEIHGASRRHPNLETYFHHDCRDFDIVFVNGGMKSKLILWLIRPCLLIFMPPLRSSQRHYVFELSVRPSVRTSRSRDRVIWRTDWSIPAKLWSCMYLAEPMNWIDFEVTRSKVKGHRAHYVYKNSSWSRYLKNRLMDSCQTLVMYVSWKANELIRFWGHEVKGQRSQGLLCMQKQLVIALSQELIDGLLPNLGHVCYLQSRWTD